MSFIRKYARRYQAETRTGPERTAKKSFKQKILDAADRQLTRLAGFKAAADLDYTPSGSSTRWWWSTRAVDGCRTIKIYVQGTLLEGDATGILVDDNVEAVRAEIERIRRYIESTSESDWAAEEARRREAMERWKARDRERSRKRRARKAGASGKS